VERNRLEDRGAVVEGQRPESGAADLAGVPDHRPRVGAADRNLRDEIAGRGVEEGPALAGAGDPTVGHVALDDAAHRRAATTDSYRSTV
jgi:hypothetical protein